MGHGTAILALSMTSDLAEAEGCFSSCPSKNANQKPVSTKSVPLGRIGFRYAFGWTVTCPRRRFAGAYDESACDVFVVRTFSDQIKTVRRVHFYAAV